MSEPVWRPDPARAAQTQIAGMAGRYGYEGTDAVDRLWQRSIDDPETFWQAVWDLGDVRYSQPATAVLENAGAMPGARWFPGAKLNFAENLLRRDDDTQAIVFRGEDGSRRVMSWHDLQQAVTALAAALRADGVGVGDRVAGYLPNIPETIVGLLAASALGAVWSSCSPDFGVRGVLDRFGQIEPKVLLTVDGYRYAGKLIDIRDKVTEVSGGLPTLRRTVMIPFVGLETSSAATAYDDYVGSRSDALAFAQQSFDHPLAILYSSGTTGIPKAIVHGQGGTLLQHIKEHRLHTDLRAGDRLFYFTTCGWMMWNWLVSGLASEATLILFDGSPFHPAPDAFWRMVEEERIGVFGTSAKWIDAQKKAGQRPRDGHDLSTLRTILSTGSPLLPESFDYIYADVKPDLQLASISGGTDIVSCFVLGNPAGAVYRGEIQMRGLGMAVDVWDSTGRPVRGDKGELVCTKPFPSMPVSFWGDPDGSRYQRSYFDRFPGVWCHGDYAEITAHQGVIIHGRSDAVLNPGGVRIGTAEIYRQVEQVEEVLEAICVGQDWDGDVRVVLFVRLRAGIELDDLLRQRIRQRIRSNCTPRHVPAKVIHVTDIPRTMSGKITELAVRDVIHGREVKNTEALANPEALAFFRDLAELRS